MVVKVLVVDDVGSWRKYNGAAVEEIFNYDVDITFADCAKKAYELLEENSYEPFDLILTDLQMELDFEPEHAGEWLVRQIKQLEIYNKTKIVIISAAYDINLIAKKFNVDYVRKSSFVSNLENLKKLLNP